MRKHTWKDGSVFLAESFGRKPSEISLLQKEFVEAGFSHYWSNSRNKRFPLPGDSAAVTFSSPIVGSHDFTIEKGHVFTHHPKKVGHQQNCQVLWFFVDHVLPSLKPKNQFAPWKMESLEDHISFPFGVRQVGPFLQMLILLLVLGKLTPPKYRNLSKGTPGTPRLCGGFFNIFSQFSPWKLGKISNLTSTFFRWLGEKPTNQIRYTGIYSHCNLKNYKFHQNVSGILKGGISSLFTTILLAFPP